MPKITPEIIKKYLPFIIILVVILALAFYLFLPKGKEAQPEVQPQVIKPQEFGAGEVGEIPGSPLPPSIFNTIGTIKEIKDNYLIAEGNGSNFADKQPRALTLIFTESTITFEPGQKVFYQGLDGLQYLKPGMRISINGDENIRGKTEFKIRTINIW